MHCSCWARKRKRPRSYEVWLAVPGESWVAWGSCCPDFGGANKRVWRVWRSRRVFWNSEVSEMLLSSRGLLQDRPDSRPLLTRRSAHTVPDDPRMPFTPTNFSNKQLTNTPPKMLRNCCEGRVRRYSAFPEKSILSIYAIDENREDASFP